MVRADLIDRLVADLAPTPRHAAVRRLAIGIGAGLVVSAILMLLWLGPRPDMMPAMATMAFWAKFAFTLLLGLAGIAAASRLARPTGRAGAPLAMTAIVLAVIAVLALVQFMMAPAPEHPALLLGISALVCPWYIMALSLPLLVGALWAMRGLAPTRLTLAGAVAGLAAGGLGAFVYSFHCIESAMPFVAIWYSLGIAGATMAGALLGRLMLRW
ncbi:MAG: DUF1109 domain-containing protein [Rhizobiales bacterium]|nr:DUF1109 domain-containing protein [Hyphomicrobiales bacterium]